MQDTLTSQIKSCQPSNATQLMGSCELPTTAVHVDVGYNPTLPVLSCTPCEHSAVGVPVHPTQTPMQFHGSSGPHFQTKGGRRPDGYAVGRTHRRRAGEQWPGAGIESTMEMQWDIPTHTGLENTSQGRKLNQQWIRTGTYPSRRAGKT